MSKRSAFVEQVVHTAERAGGSYDTRQNRRHMARRFANWCWSSGYQLQEITSIKAKHLKEYVDEQLDQGKSIRSVQNELAAIRTILRQAGRVQFADSPTINNESLGISGASRRGTKSMLPDHLHESAISALIAKGEVGVALVLELERFLGLRGEEAIRSVASLETWAKSLRVCGRIQVIFGTKGGRPRETPIPSALLQPATSAVLRAIDFAHQHGGKLIPGSLRAAQDRYHRLVRSVGLVGVYAPHSQRYWFAAQAYESCRLEGLSEREVLAKVSMALGHGDGRGRWIKATYYQSAAAEGAK